MISPSTLAAAARVIEHAAERPVTLSAGLMPPAEDAAQAATAAISTTAGHGSNALSLRLDEPSSNAAATG